MRWVAILLIAVSTAAQALPHDAYIWQRRWTGDVRAAVQQTSPLFTGWRVLAAETAPDRHLHGFSVAWAALKDKPVTAVVRIDGALGRIDTNVLMRELRALSARWPRGVALEIDYDCGTASLPTYAAFLKQVRTLKPARLSITALPAWLGADGLGAVLATVDDVVLQVHAVRSPAQGLFDAKLARRWIDRFDGNGKAFRVALPDYGTRVVRSQAGAVIALESETPKLIGGASAEELTATPQAVAELLGDLSRHPPRHLIGIAWFRLPVAGDARIWSRETLASVIGGKPLNARLTVKTRPGFAAGSADVLLVNDGETDTPLPQRIVPPPTCPLADGAGNYRYDGEKKVFIRLQNVLIPAHHMAVIGWVRCKPAGGIFHVEP